MKNKFGFTLAEVLITLGVIGVVAAMTMPTVIKKYQQHRTINQLKKVYTVLNQALKLSEIDNDSYMYWSTINDIGLKNYVDRYWYPYLKVVKICQTDAACGYGSSTGYKWKNVNNGPVQLSMRDYNLLISDGIFIMFTASKPFIYVDLNAGAGPNKYGHDFFIFSIQQNGIYPRGYGNLGNIINHYCSKTYQGNDNGEYCAAKIINDGWQIKDDYPW